MDKIGISFQSQLSRDEIRDQYIQPLRTALEQSGEGIFSNYLRQADANLHEPAEHLLVFEVNDFKLGLQRVRTEIQRLDPLKGMLLHNLNSSPPAY